jgi:hypothetical protein
MRHGRRPSAGIAAEPTLKGGAEGRREFCVGDRPDVPDDHWGTDGFAGLAARALPGLRQRQRFGAHVPDQHEHDQRDCGEQCEPCSVEIKGANGNCSLFTEGATKSDVSRAETTDCIGLQQSAKPAVFNHEATEHVAASELCAVPVEKARCERGCVVEMISQPLTYATSTAWSSPNVNHSTSRAVDHVNTLSIWSDELSSGTWKLLRLRLRELAEQAPYLCLFVRHHRLP